MTELQWLDLSGNRLTDFSFLFLLPNLNTLLLLGNDLTNLTLPAGLTNLTTLNLGANRLTNLSLPNGLVALNSLELRDNQLTNLTLSAEITNVTELGLGSNPLKTFVLSSQLQRTSLADNLASLQNQGVSIYAYPLAVSLGSVRRTIDGAATFTLTGPPGIYRIEVTADFSTWTEVESVTNTTGTAELTDPATPQRTEGFYRAIRSE